MDEAVRTSCVKLRVTTGCLLHESRMLWEQESTSGSFAVPVALLFPQSDGQLWLHWTVQTSSANVSLSNDGYYWPSSTLSVRWVSKAYAQALLPTTPNPAAAGLQHPALLVVVVVIVLIIGAIAVVSFRRWRQRQADKDDEERPKDNPAL